MHSKKGLYNLSTSLIYKILTCVVGLLIPRLFVLSYGSELNGLQSSITQIFAYITLIEAGVGEATLQSLFQPIAEKDYKKANSILSATTYYYNRIGLIYFILLFSLAILYPLFIHVENVSFLTIFGYIVFAGLTTGINFFFQSKIILILQADGTVYINSMIITVTYLLTSIVKIVCILSEMNIVLIQFGFFVVNMIGTGVYYTIARHKYGWINFHEKPNMNAIEQKNSVMIHKIAGIVFQNTDIVILTVVCGLKVVSVYTMYKLVINMITTVIASLGDSINFVFGQTYNGPNRAGYQRLIDTFNVYYSAIAFALFSVTSILILPFLKLYTAGMDINYIFPILPLLYIGIEILQVGREAMMRTITVAGHFRKTQKAAIIEMIINLCVSIVLVLIFKELWGSIAGLYGVLCGTIVALLYRTFDINHYANKIILGRSSFKTNKVMITNAVLYGIILLFTEAIELEINNYFQFMKWGAILSVYIVLFSVVAQSALNLTEFKYLLSFVKSRTFVKSRKNK